MARELVHYLDALVFYAYEVVIHPAKLTAEGWACGCTGGGLVWDGSCHGKCEK